MPWWKDKFSKQFEHDQDEISMGSTVSEQINLGNPGIITILKSLIHLQLGLFDRDQNVDVDVEKLLPEAETVQNRGLTVCRRAKVIRTVKVCNELPFA